MQQTATNDEGASDAIAAYLAASGTALASAQALDKAWRLHFEADADEPAADWIGEVAEQQMASALALLRARQATRTPVGVLTPGVVTSADSGSMQTGGTRRRRRRENRFVAKMGAGGQRLLRGALLMLLLLAALVAAGAGISLSLEVAGILHVIDDPVQLPVGIQLTIFIGATALAFALRKLVRPLERALYGGKGVRPKTFRL